MSSTKSALKAKQPCEARLLSWEFAPYYLAIAAAAHKFVVGGYQVSQQILQATGVWERQRLRLRPGWLFGFSQDLSDIQWRLFREGLHQILAALLCFILLSSMVQHVFPRARPMFYLLCGLAFTGYLHGTSVIFPLTLSLLNFCIANSRLARPWTIWTFNCTSLLAARMLEGGSFAALSQRLEFMDRLQGPLQWHISYNLLILRQISFGMDKYWARKRRTATGQEVTRDAASSLKARQTVPLQDAAYSLVMYLGYLFYPPLYIAGPILTFNSFASQQRQPIPVHLKQLVRTHWRQLALYAGRLAGALLLMEVMTHTLYFNSIAKHKLWQQYAAELNLRAVHVGMTGFWVLMFMWLKFLIIWRFFRMWAWADGIHTHENMLRCICNNYDIEGFWKGWHASYNQWLVRYMYIPLGGASKRLFNVWVVFTFVALWHDLEWHLLGWAWLMCLFFLPEMAVKWAFKQPWAAALRQQWYYRHLSAAAGCCNIIALMIANLVGFVVGTKGIQPVLLGCLADIWFLAGTLIVCYSAVQIMFEIRLWEQRRTISSKDNVIKHAPKLGSVPISVSTTDCPDCQALGVKGSKETSLDHSRVVPHL